MPNIKSAEKRVRKSAKARLRNVEAKTKIKGGRRELFSLFDKKDKEGATKAFSEYCSVLDKSVKRGIITKNTAVRRKSRASDRLKAL
ncbi:MAG TPA: 30S ribosomal protein S20 [Verrucomicrobia bacterium]|nr:MAG: 30S ribosomal protein S20 [Lentisphaerae bacterium GWF2_57_35]HBA85074.1 30S ribosomal protein S20 [Verrucomicrobiota bacterium]